MADLHVILHIPKTGGQSIRFHLQRNLQLDAEYVHIGPFGRRHANETGALPWEERSDAERARARVLHGHHVTRHSHEHVPGARTVKHAGLLRDPASRMVSHYNFNVELKWVRKGQAAPDWAWWYRGQKRNFVCRWIKENFLGLPFDETQPDESLFAEITGALEGFWLLATLPHFDAFAARLYADIGVPPPTPRRVNVAGRAYPARVALDDEIRLVVSRDHPVDCAVYDWAHRRTEQGLAP